MSILPSGYPPYTPRAPGLRNFDASDSLHLSEFDRQCLGKAPKYPHYSDPNVRYQSFRDWPKDKGQNPFALSMAGFFYAGKICLMKVDLLKQAILLLLLLSTSIIQGIGVHDISILICFRKSARSHRNLVS